jgi:hypothetical protein
MDQQVFEQSPAKYRSILLEMRRDASPGLNMLYLSGLAETFALIDAENGLEPGSHNLNVRSIARVMRAWGDFEGETWAGGFVLELRDGRRVYVESYADGPDWGPGSCVSVVAVPTHSLPAEAAKEPRLRAVWLGRGSPRAERLLETAGLCPLTPPTVAPIPKPTIPPLGTTSCRQVQVLNPRTNQHEWRQVCQ